MSWRIINGDALTVLRDLPEKSVHCCVTSPPYWGLRDYGTGSWDGGSASCSHRIGGQVQDSKWPGAITTGQRPGADASRCLECGARRIDQQLGLERTPEEYVSKMVEVFREVRRVLRDDGTLWLNLGDSYSGYHGNRRVPDGEAPSNKPGYVENMRLTTVGIGGLKPKDLVGIPWMVAFALRADGWFLRSDIIWSKPNPMPESVRDRPTKAHEYVFLLSKSQRYWYDADAIKSPAKYPDGPNSPGSIKSPYGQRYKRRADKQRGHGRSLAVRADRALCARYRPKRSEIRVVPQEAQRTLPCRMLRNLLV